MKKKASGNEKWICQDFLTLQGSNPRHGGKIRQDCIPAHEDLRISSCVLISLLLFPKSLSLSLSLFFFLFTGRNSIHPWNFWVLSNSFSITPEWGGRHEGWYVHFLRTFLFSVNFPSHHGSRPDDSTTPHTGRIVLHISASPSLMRIWITWGSYDSVGLG